VTHYCPYDLLVIDLRMPGLNGCHVVRFIVNHRRDLLDRILVTSAATPREHPELIGSSTTELPWLRKPFRPEELVEKANEIVASAPPPAPAWLSFR
jgi:CheY-like chemotaxis protein